MTYDATLTPVEAPATQALALPCTGQALRTALQQRDLRALNELTRHLRIAGYRFEPLVLAGELLQSGCAWVSDAFGHPVPVHVRATMRPTPPRTREPSPAFTLAL
jgi:hypothetical protein